MNKLFIDIKGKKIDNVKYTVPSGTAHYLEHLKFNTSEGDVTALFSDLGCDSNAYTSTTETALAKWSIRSEARPNG